MKSIPLISVIVPIYGVEKYIERCARSIFEQTYQLYLLTIVLQTKVWISWIM